MDAKARLGRVGLGTAQFGTRYGVSNAVGRPAEKEIAAILAHAVETGFGYLDTAAGYGDAEAVIGRHLPRHKPIRIVSKLPGIKEPEFEAAHREKILDAVAASLDRLKTPRLHGILIHQAGDLGKPGWQYLVEALQEAKTRGWVERAGVSIYGADDLALLENRFKPDLIQLPFNILDRRLLASGWLDRLNANGVEIHARSIFLQGLLLMNPAGVPEFFEPIRPALDYLSALWARLGISPLAGCLAFGLRQRPIGAIIVGVNQLSELEEIEAAAIPSDGGEFDFDSMPPVDPVYLDPRRWPQFAR